MPRKITQRKYNRSLSVPYPGLQRLDVESLELLRLVQRGIMYKDIAERFQIVKSTICFRLRRDFPEEYRQLRKNPTVTQHFIKSTKAYKAFKQTGTINGAARKLNLSSNTVRERIRFMKRVLGE